MDGRVFVDPIELNRGFVDNAHELDENEPVSMPSQSSLGAMLPALRAAREQELKQTKLT